MPVNLNLAKQYLIQEKFDECSVDNYKFYKFMKTLFKDGLFKYLKKVFCLFIIKKHHFSY